MRTTMLVFLWLLSAAFGGACAEPREVDCPLIHPENPVLEFIGASLDQTTRGRPRQPEPDDELTDWQNKPHFLTYYASYRIHRDAVLICSYAEVRGRRIVDVGQIRDLRFPMPGILMRCDGDLREATLDTSAEWKRRWCVHDPDE